ncbi:Endoplasmic reticulum aminopeptidase 1 [Papilio xuthus]|uniref:Endoplasmic reticulum aminopeptidase 1 n=1 Tax=Papilio xuthus TaxID=66420 RepID=A0A194QEJ1_PAPXU|nr:Endoplasmic reticulum aminopeptidase 1 [Papilio xuthus]
MALSTSRQQFLACETQGLDDIHYGRKGGIFISTCICISFVIFAVILAFIVGVIVYFVTYFKISQEAPHDFWDNTEPFGYTNAPSPDLRLPPHVFPSFYRLKLKTDIENSVFSGDVYITLRASKQVKEIILHSKGLSINKNATLTEQIYEQETINARKKRETSNTTDITTINSVLVPQNESENSVTTENNTDIINHTTSNPLTNLELIVDTQVTHSSVRNIKILSIKEGTGDRLILTLESPLKSDIDYILELSFAGNISNSMTGFYKSTYTTSKNEIKNLGVTQFEPTSARAAFPCFDEPAFKAKFEISILHPANMTALSNMKVSAEENVEEEPGWQWTHFDRSVNMSTYLVAYVISDFHYLETNYISKDNITKPIKIWTRPELIHKAKYALSITPKLLEYYEHVFGLPYALEKLDLIAIPDFSSGAMENWGLITFRETTLLFDKDENVPRDKQSVAIDIAHELAHQWFGNLVTMKWWTDLWLNEGFATYIEYVGVDHTLDISWKYSNAVENDLWAAMSEVIKNHSMFQHLSVVDFMNSWTRQAGYPVVNVDRDYNTGKVTFSQKLFTSSGEPYKEMTDQVWHIPLSYATMDVPRANWTTRPRLWLTDRSATTDLQINHTEALYVNIDAIDISGTVIWIWLKFVIDVGHILIEPEWKMFESLTQDKMNLLKSDALKNTSPVSRKVVDASEISQKFDEISYMKGANLIRMLNNTITEELFHKGLETYLNNCSGEPYKEMTDQVWHIPLSYATMDVPRANWTTRPRLWLTDRSATTDLQINHTEALYVNIDAIGYYRVNYDKRNWELLNHALKSDAFSSPLTKAQLIDDAFNFAKADQLEYSYALGLTTCVINGEDSKIVWDLLLSNMYFLKHSLRATSGYVYFQDYMKIILKKQLERLNYGLNTPKDDNEAFLIENLVMWECLVESPRCLDWAREQFYNWSSQPDLTNNPIPNYLRSLVYNMAVKHGGRREFDFFWNLFLNSTDPGVRSQAINVLPSTRDESLISMLLEKSLTEIPKQYAVAAWSVEPPLGTRLAQDFLIHNFHRVYDKFSQMDAFMFPAVVGGAFGFITTTEELNKLKKFAHEHKEKLMPMSQTLQKIVDSAALRIHWLQRHAAHINSWFHHYVTVNATMQESVDTTTQTLLTQNITLNIPADSAHNATVPPTDRADTADSVDSVANTTSPQ